MYILGINAYHGDVSAVLVRDGDLIAAVEEERLRRVKHWAGFPAGSIRRCLEIGGIAGADVDHVAISRDPWANLPHKARFAVSRWPSPQLLVDRVRNSRKVRHLRDPIARALNVPPKQVPRIHHVEHHPAHVASAFFVSPFNEAAVCAVDGFGDFVSTSMAVGRDNGLKVIERICFPHSLGMLFTAVTQYLGFQSYGDEFKVMGLAPYGKPRFAEELRTLVNLKDAGRFELSLEYFRHWRNPSQMEWDEGYPTLAKIYSPALEDLLGPARRPDEQLSDRHEDIACSLQAVYEECAYHVLNALWERTRLPCLCLAGGCAMNSVANGGIRANTPFRELYIQPAAADNGTALGAAYWIWNRVLSRPRSFVMDHCYWGPEYPNADVIPAVRTHAEVDDVWDYSWRRAASTDDLCKETARLIADGNIVGWFQGRMEWGARALGNRSILADPRREDIRDLINTKIKFRERFRPFAPSVLEEELDEYFVGAVPDPFMQQVYPVREDMRHVIPAVTHVDGSGRVQTVSECTNPRYHRLIREFARITGVPLLLNTSFNENEPIVDTPEQALDCFLRTRMDAIVVNDTIVRRRPAERAAAVAGD